MFIEQSSQANFRAHRHLQRSLITRVALSELQRSWLLFVNGDAIPLADVSLYLAHRLSEESLIAVTAGIEGEEDMALVNFNAAVEAKGPPL